MHQNELVRFLQENKVEMTFVNGDVRVWKLGDHKEGILPKKAAADKLLGLLEKCNLDGTDIVWDSMIQVEALSTNVAKVTYKE